jgi:hypothetical protein
MTSVFHPDSLPIDDIRGFLFVPNVYVPNVYIDRRTLSVPAPGMKHEFGWTQTFAFPVISFQMACGTLPRGPQATTH